MLGKLTTQVQLKAEYETETLRQPPRHYISHIKNKITAAH